jgi:hypothetical protein
MDLAKLKRIKDKAYQRLCVVRTRASDDERYLNDGGRVKPRYRSVERARARWTHLNNLYSATLKQENLS